MDCLNLERRSPRLFVLNRGHRQKQHIRGYTTRGEEAMNRTPQEEGNELHEEKWEDGRDKHVERSGREITLQ